MDRMQKLINLELNKPRKYNQLKDDPFPYLLQSNRFQIFEFICEIQAENQRLAHQVSLRFPTKTLQQCMDQHRGLQAKRKLIEINKASIQKMDIEIKDKMQRSQQLRLQNKQLEAVQIELVGSLEAVESELIEAEKERRLLEMKLKLQQERQSKKVDLSFILNNLYKEVKDTLNSPL